MIKPVFQALTVLAALAGGMTVAVAADGNNGKGKGAEKSEKADKTDKSDKAEDTSKPDKQETSSKAAKPDAAAVTSKPETVSTPAKPEVASVPAAPKAAEATAPKNVLPKTSVDAQIVLPEVATEKALSLSQVRSALARVSNGRMLDIGLAEVDGRLVYEVTVLEAGNVARHIVIDAKSGQEVGDPR